MTLAINDGSDVIKEMRQVDFSPLAPPSGKGCFWPNGGPIEHLGAQVPSPDAELSVVRTHARLEILIGSVERHTLCFP